MSILPGYKITLTLKESPGSRVFRALRESDGFAVVLKTVEETFAAGENERGFQSLKREFDLLQELDVEGVVRPLALERFKNQTVLILEEGGNSLDNFRMPWGDGLENFLWISREIASLLVDVHGRNIVHGALEPAHFLYDIERSRVRLGGFGHACKLPPGGYLRPQEYKAINSPIYIAPELSGRLNRNIDFRCDIYSLGVCLYELLLGRPPFIESDPEKLLYSHIAETPPDPEALNPEIPSVLRKILLKLLAKAPQDRYQSAYGLKIDLERCLSEVKAGETNFDFEPGERDISRIFHIPKILVGRDAERTRLIKAYESIRSGGRALYLIGGPPGVGKSSLINSLAEYVQKNEGVFISGKFEQYRSGSPYSALLQALEKMVDSILSEEDAQSGKWKRIILERLGGAGRIMTGVIPRLERIIGEQPDVPPLSPREEKNRFELTLFNFIRAFSTPGHPLVLFLDDLHWSDNSSLAWLSKTSVDQRLDYLLILGAYRESEAGPELPALLRKSEAMGGDAFSIHLSPLDEESIVKLLRASLRRGERHVYELARLCSQKTGGNPFFLRQFLYNLFREGLLRYDMELERWDWDLELIIKAGVTDNVVELMMERIKELDFEVRDVLKVGAFVGATLEPGVLAWVMNQNEGRIKELLEHSVQVGLLVREGERYMFSHDRVQQGAYSLTSKSERAALRFMIGTILFENFSPARREERIFEIAEHLNAGRKYVNTAPNLVGLAKINYQAGLKAKKASSFSVYYKYMKTALEFSERAKGADNRELRLKILMETARGAYLNSEFDRMSDLTTKGLQICQSDIERLEIYEIIIMSHEVRGDYYGSLEVGLEALRPFKISYSMSEKFLKLRALIFLLMFYFSIRRRGLEKLKTLPDMKDPLMLSLSNLLTRLSSSAFLLNPIWTFIIQSRLIRMTLRHGKNSGTPFFVTLNGTLLSSILPGLFLFGYELARVGQDMARRLPPGPWLPRAMLPFYGRISYIREPLRDSIDGLRTTARMSREMGELDYQGYSEVMLILNSLMSGVNLDDLIAEIQEIRLNSAMGRPISFWLKLYERCVHLLWNNVSPTFPLKGEVFNNDELVAELSRSRDGLGIYYYYHENMVINFLFYRFDESMKYLVKARGSEHIVSGFYFGAALNFYESLIYLSLYPRASLRKRRKFLRRIKKNQKKLKQGVDNNPCNFIHKYLIIEGELARVKGKPDLALEFFEKAAREARRYEYLNLRALAFERAGMACLEANMNTAGGVYLEQARNAYLEWGARSKAAHLTEVYAEILKDDYIEPDWDDVTEETASLSVLNSIDIKSVLKASLAISEIIVLDELQEKMTEIAIRNSGARKGVLLLEEEGRWRIEAEGNLEGGEVRVTQNLPGENESEEGRAANSQQKLGSLLPMSVVEFTARRKKILVLDDALGAGDFQNDSYVIAHRPRSILCIPLLNQERLRGIFYLENNLAAHIFTPERLEVLRLLSSQMAISIDNALLYENRRKVEELTKMDQVKSAFFTNISHEFRTPLTLILSPLERLLEEQSFAEDSEERLLLEVVHKNALTLLRLIENLLDISRIEADRLELELGEIDLVEFVRNIFFLFYPASRARSLELNFHSTEERILIPGDPRLLERVFLNLIGNALKFTEKGGIYIDILKNLDKVYVKVRDTGPGMDDDIRESIFERFVSGISGHSQRGSGLGLYLVREILQAHGGRLELETQLAEGSVFIVELPLYPAPENKKAKINSISDYKIPGSAEKSNRFLREGALLELTPDKGVDEIFPHEEVSQSLVNYYLTVDKHEHEHLLILGTDIASIDELKKTLSDYFEISTAANGDEGIQLALSLRPDIIISDIRSPRADDYSFLKTLRENEELQNTALVVLGSQRERADPLLELELGVDDYISRHAPAAEIILRLKNICNRKRYGELGMARERARIYSDLHDYLGARITDLGVMAHKLSLDTDLPVAKSHFLTELQRGIILASESLRNGLNNSDDLSLLAGDFVNGVHLILLRRYSHMEREFHFQVEGDARTRFRNIPRERQRYAFYGVIQELVGGDLKYGEGVTEWIISSSGEGNTLMLEMISRGEYRQFSNSGKIDKSEVRLRFSLSGGELRETLTEDLYRVKIILEL